MKVRTLQENLRSGLGIVTRAAAGPRSVLPALSSVLLRAELGRLQLAATNLEMMIVCPVGARIEEEGAALIPAQTLHALVKNLPPEVVDLEVESAPSDGEASNTLRLQCAHLDTSLRGMSAEEFPTVPAFPSEDTDGLSQSTPGLRQVEINAEPLCQMIDLVVFAAADDASRPVLTGVLLQYQQGEFLLVATDGFRLSAYGYPLEGAQREDGSSQDQAEGGGEAPESPEAVSAIIPSQALREMARLCAKSEEPVTIAIAQDRSKVFFRHQGVMLTSQLIEGHFPDYTQIVPASWKTRAGVNRAVFLQAVRTAGILAQEHKVIRLSFTSGDSATPGLVAVASSGELGSHVGEFEASVKGEDLTIGFDANYLVAVLSRLDSDRVVLETGSPTSPLVIRPGNDEGDKDYIHIIMPLNIVQEAEAES